MPAYVPACQVLLLVRLHYPPHLFHLTKCFTCLQCSRDAERQAKLQEASDLTASLRQYQQDEEACREAARAAQQARMATNT